MNTDSRSTVFLCHASADWAFVQHLKRKLEDDGWRVLVDSEHLRPGDTLPDTFRDLIDSADHVVGVLSPQAVALKWVRRELR